MNTNDYLEKVRQHTLAIKKAEAKIAHCKDTIQRSEAAIANLHMMFTSGDVVKAIETIKEWCKSTTCERCPFYENNPFISKECKMFKTLPRNWDITVR